MRYCTLIEGGQDPNGIIGATMEATRRQAFAPPFGGGTDEYSLEFETAYIAALTALRKYMDLAA
jgi:hypothetical protein